MEDKRLISKKSLKKYFGEKEMKSKKQLIDEAIKIISEAYDEASAKIQLGVHAILTEAKNKMCNRMYQLEREIKEIKLRR